MTGPRFKVVENKSGCHCCALYDIMDLQENEVVCSSDDEGWMEVILDCLNSTYTWIGPCL